MKRRFGDLADARRTVGSDGPYDTACFHAQQAIEKYLKAVPAIEGQPIPRTHDLDELQRLCFPLLSLADLSALSARTLVSPCLRVSVVSPW